MLYTMSHSETEEWQKNAISKNILEGGEPKKLRKTIAETAKSKGCSAIALEDGQIVKELI